MDIHKRALKGYTAMIFFFSHMRRQFSASLALLGIALGLALGVFAPMPAMAQADASILPSQDKDTAIADCATLRQILDTDPKSIEGEYLALKIRCGRMLLGDLPAYFKHALSFVLNIIGTLAVIAIIRAGYIFMLSKDKDYGAGRKAVFQVLIGLLIAALSFTAAQIVLRVLFAVSNAS